MTAMERPATSGHVLVAATLWFTPITDTSGSSYTVVPSAISDDAPRGRASGDLPVAFDVLSNVFITNLAAARVAGQDSALPDLYRRLTVAAIQRGYRVTHLILAGEDLVDSPSDDVILEVYVEGLRDENARLDLWETLSAVVEDSSSAFLLEKLALVVHGKTA
ncbi:MAG: hypothetical protein KDK70_18925 [Myxococcales bacterium]|nr:hypothetical protein [Myxococcales bacterium]